jgi:hypothetical protein
MNFGDAIGALKDGEKVAREGWNGKGMFIYYVPARERKTEGDIERNEFGEFVPCNPYLAIKNVNGSVSTWVPSINDVLAEDWNLL